ncbi:MAG: hypothetical protein HY046_02565 [Acidobacteria bacterium]|nr:hypothetical protein [Acidobacteriota bacterium]
MAFKMPTFAGTGRHPGLVQNPVEMWKTAGGRFMAICVAACCRDRLIAPESSRRVEEGEFICGSESYDLSLLPSLSKIISFSESEGDSA